MPDDGAQSFVLSETKDSHAAVPMSRRDQHLAVVRQAEQLTVQRDTRVERPSYTPPRPRQK